MKYCGPEEIPVPRDHHIFGTEVQTDECQIPLGRDIAGMSTREGDL